MRNELLLNDKALLMIGKSHFRLNHPEFDQVAACLGFLRPERWAEGIHLAQRHRCGLHVELTALSQISILIEIFRMEQVRCSFR
ncbi:hypothetical protein D3C77_527110 [compost metagenome]